MFQNQVVVDRKMNILDLLTGEEDPQDYLEKLMADWDIWSASMKVKAVRKGHVTSVPPFILYESYVTNRDLRFVLHLSFRLISIIIKLMILKLNINKNEVDD